MDRLEELKPIPGNSASDHAYEQLRRVIFLGSLLPGDPVPEKLAAERLVVSQSTLRQALVRLEIIGLITKEKRHSFVTNFTIAELRERIDVRIMLEGPASLAASKSLEKDDFERLRDLCKKMRKRGFVEADFDLHRLIWQRSGNQTLYNQLLQLTTPMFALINSIRPVVKDRAEQHDKLVDVLKEGDPNKIEEIVREHAFGAYQYFLEGDFKDLREGIMCIDRDEQESDRDADDY